MNSGIIFSTVLLLCFLTPLPVLGIPSNLSDFSISELNIVSPDGLEEELGKAFTGDFDGDGRLDVAHLTGDRVILIYAPSVYQASMLLDSTGDTDIKDACVVQGADKDEIITIGTDGALSWHLGNDGQFTSLPLSAHPGRAVAMVDSTLAILTLNGASLILIDPSTGSETFEVLQATGISLLPLQWSLDPAKELAVMTDSGIKIFNMNGDALASFDSGTPADLTALRDSGSILDTLAWIDSNSLGSPGGVNQVLHLVSSLSLQTEISLGNTNVLGINSGDLDGDGRSDLLLAVVDDCAVDILWGLDPSIFGARFDPLTSLRLKSQQEPRSCPGSSIAVRPLCADFDRDGTLDVVRPVSHDHGLLIARNTLNPDVSAYSPSPCVEVIPGRGSTSVILSVDETHDPGDEVDVLIFVRMDDGSVLADPYLWFSLTEQISSLNAQVQFSLDSSGVHHEYYIVTRRIPSSGISTPDAIHVYRPGEPTSCPPTTTFGRYVEGLNPLPIINFEDIIIPPGSDED